MADTFLVTETTKLESVRYDKQTGLVPVVVQDDATEAVLMVAYANREALKRTFGTGEAWFWSRSRNAYWHKGETSGNTQKVKEVRLDCDGDTVLYRVEPRGPACHTGVISCFYRQVTRHSEEEAGPAGSGPQVQAGTQGAVAQPLATGSSDHSLVAASPETTLSAGMDLEGIEVLGRLWDTLSDRWHNRPQGAYTTYLFEQGIDKLAKKLGEESVEVVIAAKNAVATSAGQAEVASESADLLFHLLALWKAAGVTPHDVFEVLKSREK